MEKNITKLSNMNSINSSKFFNLLVRDKFLITRVGNVEFNACRGKHLHEFPSSVTIPTCNTIDQYIRRNAGFYYKKPYKSLNCRQVFYLWQNKYINCMFDSDLVLVYKHHLKDFLHIFEKETNVIHKINHEVFFEDLEFYLYLLEFYTSILDKKILIVSHFTDTMQKQLQKFKMIFPQYNIKTENIIFYKSFQTIEGNSIHSNWLETFEMMANDIEKLDFDITFMGCGCYGLPLAHHIYTKMNKSCLYLGGIIQLLFAIRGRRWEIRSKYSTHFLFKKLNNYWIYPAEHEKPFNYKNVEDGCYW